jgi:hypothetical protein
VMQNLLEDIEQRLKPIVLAKFPHAYHHGHGRENRILFDSEERQAKAGIVDQEERMALYHTPSSGW